ncbi:hypothetical protein [Maridesulfovibrio ferrireducens]|uniref:hypothetical protein n=1 Tax=Maridesulfovibrio ferrireducens TaxID=246191 RepID=UPI001A306C00|nr:hypothetical protein [Maridesulfovibrio ferrireducens]MBI9110024.1 hypothetical protein [Maridesulfovibrio ferrireducens]
MLKTSCGNAIIHLKGQPTKEDVFILIGMALLEADQGFSCENCWHYQHESADEYGSYSYYYCEHPDQKIARCGNLKSFPFKNAPARCFEINYWHHPFVNGYFDEEGEEGKGGRYKQLTWLTRGYNQYGIPRLKPENEAICRKAFVNFCKRTGFNLAVQNA